jgi:sRNA-binding carbon storage regulator CsrA
MFLLNRKVGERLIFVLPRCELTLTVTAIEGDKVRLSISAPVQNAVNGKKIHEREFDADSAMGYRLRMP